VYDKAVAVVQEYMGDLGAETKSWLKIKEVRSFQVRLKEQEKLATSNAAAAAKRKTPRTSKTPDTNPVATKTISERVKKELFKKRRLASLKGHATRKRKLQDDETVKRKRKKEEEAEKRKKKREEEAAKRKKKREEEAAKRKKKREEEAAKRKKTAEEDAFVAKVVGAVTKKVKTTVADNICKELAPKFRDARVALDEAVENLRATTRNALDDAVQDLRTTTSKVAEKTVENSKVIQECAVGLGNLKQMMTQATQMMGSSIAGSARAPPSGAGGYHDVFAGTFNRNVNKSDVFTRALSAFMFSNRDLFR
jgi:hypothetical protein